LTDFFNGSDVDASETPTVDSTSVVISPNTSSSTTFVSPLVVFGTGNTTSVVVDTANYDFLNDGEQAVFDVFFDIVSGPDTVTESFTIRINGENDAPVASAGSNATATAGGGAVIIESAFTASDVDSAQLSSATISISSGFVFGEDSLNFVNTAAITGNFDGTTGVLTLTGPASTSDFETAIQGITFQNSGSSTTATTRTISYVLNDGADDSVTVTSTIDVDAALGGGTEGSLSATFSPTGSSIFIEEKTGEDSLGKILSKHVFDRSGAEETTDSESIPLSYAHLVEDVSLGDIDGIGGQDEAELFALDSASNEWGDTGSPQTETVQFAEFSANDTSSAQIDEGLSVQSQMQVLG